MSKYKVIVKYIEKREFVIEAHNQGWAAKEAIGASEYQGEDEEFLKVITHPNYIECEATLIEDK